MAVTPRERREGRYVKNAAGLYVPEEPISKTLIASATTGDVLCVASDDTILPKTLVNGSNVTITHGAGTITIAASGGGGGGLTAPTLRSSAIQSSSASSYNVSFPTGAAAGDVCVLFAGHGWDAANPSGWTVIDNSIGANFNGGAWAKELTAGDISTGHVTLSFGGAYNGVIAIACFEGAPGAIRTDVSSRNTSGASTRSLSTSWDIATSDYILYFGANRANNTVTCDRGSALQSVAASEASGVLTGGSPGSGGSVTATWSYPTTPSGDYQILVAFQGR